MTIVTSVKVRDGLVLGTDSMTQITRTFPDGTTVFAKAYANARKLFDLEPASAGAMTYGLGNIGEQSIEGLVREFRPVVNHAWTIQELATHLFEFIEPKWREVAGDSQDPRYQIGFCVAGYSPDAPFAETYEFLLPRDAAPSVASAQTDFGLLWRGIERPLVRLVRGFDFEILSALREAGLDQAQVESMIAPHEWFLSQPGMPLQDAVNLVDFLLSTTIGVSSFVEPNPTCGGPLQVATILPDRGFTWINQPELSLPRR
jgi:hypothetical protein